ncbi:MAG: hypothetical protein EKK64_03465 [Neisseriaceae bacterium]|nr:MAG: hypothetical protein EKK64_03465 [Neisseriaceae bacterium]
MNNLLVMNGEITEITKEGVIVALSEVDKNRPLEIMEIKKSCFKKEDLDIIYEGLPLTISVVENNINGTIKGEFKIKLHYTQADLELKKLKENV